MDPLTAAFTAYATSLQAWMEFYRGGTAEQKAQLVQIYIEDIQWWRGLLIGLRPKE